MNAETNNILGGHGMITVEYTVFCYHCMNWEYLYAENKRHAADNARAKGWKLNRKLKRWCCPECVKEQTP